MARDRAERPDPADHTGPVGEPHPEPGEIHPRPPARRCSGPHRGRRASRRTQPRRKRLRRRMAAFMPHGPDPARRTPARRIRKVPDPPFRIIPIWIQHVAHKPAPPDPAPDIRAPSRGQDRPRARWPKCPAPVVANRGSERSPSIPSPDCPRLSTARASGLFPAAAPVPDICGPEPALPLTGGGLSIATFGPHFQSEVQHRPVSGARGGRAEEAGPVLKDFPARAPYSTRNAAAVPSDWSVTGPPGGGRAPRRGVARPSGRGRGWPDRNRAGGPAEFPLPRRPTGRSASGRPRPRESLRRRQVAGRLAGARVQDVPDPLHACPANSLLLSTVIVWTLAPSPLRRSVIAPPTASALFRALRDVPPARDMTPARVATTLPVRFLSPPPQVPARRSSVPAVRAYEVVYPLTADHAGVLQPETPRDLFRAPALLQLRHDLRPALLRQLPRDRRGPAPAPGGLPPRLSLPVSPPAAVASDLPRYGGRMAARPPGDGPVRKPAFPRRVYPASSVEGQMTVALGHDTLLSCAQGLSPLSGRFAGCRTRNAASHHQRCRTSERNGGDTTATNSVPEVRAYLPGGDRNGPASPPHGRRDVETARQTHVRRPFPGESRRGDGVHMAA